MLLCSVSGTELRGNTTICPGNSGIFECKTTNTEILTWRVNETSLFILGDHRLNDTPVIVSGIVASLVELSLSDGNVGNRTSLLRIAPVNNVTMTVTCSGGSPTDTCSRDINFIGSYL